ncbi:MAG: hypothetical protein AB7O59_16985 [Pirellulales bacterium]
MATVLAAGLLSGVSASAHAQFVPKTPTNAGTAVANAAANQAGVAAANNGAVKPVIPGTIVPGGQTMTSEQMQAIMMYRALQMRGRGRVRTGMPQFIPLGGMGYDEQQFQQQQQMMNGAGGGAGGGGGSADPADAKKQEIKQRRIEARKAAEEKKRAAREAAKAKARQKAAARPAKNNAADAQGAN